MNQRPVHLLPETSFRSIDGTDNNISNPDWNAANSDETRIAPANFAPGTTNVPVDGPNPREISNVVASGPNAELNDPTGLSAMMYVWGQFVDHDLDRNPDGSDSSISIPIPSDDPTFTNGGTIALTRGVADPANGNAVNAVTGWLDASMIYGSDVQTAASLRLPDGHLKTSDGNNLPIVDGAFAAGDIRVSENPDLSALTTLFVREHNYWVDTLRQQHPHWTGNQLYQMARAIVTAEIQNITYSEFLPHLLGPNAIPRYDGYDPSVDPRITEEFSTAAFRFGHSIVSGTETKLDNNGTALASQSLADAFFNTPAQVMADGGVDALIRNFANDVAQNEDVYAIDELRNQLSDAGETSDLIAIDIERERDLGLGTLNQSREALGLQPYTDFSQITSDAVVQANLEQVYGSVDSVDLFIGGLAEDHVPGAMVGSTFQAIIAQQFQNLRDGDRFWWQNQGFDPATARQIQNTTLADIIMRDTNTAVVQQDVFVSTQRHLASVAPTDPTAPQLVIGDDIDNETVAGGPADDTIVAGLGQNQILSGGGGSDVFVFNHPNLTDTILDFDPSNDLIQFPKMTIEDFLVTSGDDGQAVVRYNGDTIYLTGVLPDELSRQNFMFVPHQNQSQT